MARCESCQFPKRATENVLAVFNGDIYLEYYNIMIEFVSKHLIHTKFGIRLAFRQINFYNMYRTGLFCSGGDEKRTLVNSVSNSTA